MEAKKIKIIILRELIVIAINKKIVWVGNKPLCCVFPRTYNLTFALHVSVAKLFAGDFNHVEASSRGGGG
jgi:hypothetical protein